jgi:sulfite reductase alpha subunit-like flavoprotein
VLPADSPELCAQTAASLGVELDHIFSMQHLLEGDKSLPLPFSGPCSVGRALAYYCNLLAPPKKDFLLALAQYASGSEKGSAGESRLGGRQGRLAALTSLCSP